MGGKGSVEGRARLPAADFKQPSEGLPPAAVAAEAAAPFVLLCAGMFTLQAMGWEVDIHELVFCTVLYYLGIWAYLLLQWGAAVASGETRHEQYTKPYARFPDGAGRHAFWKSHRTMALVGPFGILWLYAIRGGMVPLVYDDVAERGWPYLALSCVAGFLIQDTAFYWVHRALHTDEFWPWHVEHHEYITGRTCNIFTAVAAGVAELAMEGIATTFLPPLIIPMHWFVASGVMPMSYAVWTVSNHMIRPWRVAGGMINDRDCHLAHHRHGQKNGNFAFYFTHWDRLCGTVV